MESAMRPSSADDVLDLMDVSFHDTEANGADHVAGLTNAVSPAATRVRWP